MVTGLILVVQTVLYSAHNIAAWSALLLVGEDTGKSEGGDEGVDSVHAAVHLLDAARLNSSRSLLCSGPYHCSIARHC